MKKPILLLIISLLCIAVSAQNFQWGKKMGNSNEDAGHAITLDHSGNVYTTGRFVRSVDLDPGSGSSMHTSAGWEDIFILKLDSSGNFIWARSIGGKEHDLAWTIKTDALGNVYVAGSFAGTVDFDPGVGTFELVSATDRTIFILKLDAAGNFLWAKDMAGGSGEARSIGIDLNGFVYVAGGFDLTVAFGPVPGSYAFTAAGATDIFVLKLSPAGDLIWVRVMGGKADDVVYSLAVNVGGGIYLCGTFWDSCDFDPGAGIFQLVSVRHEDIFIAKLDAAGNFLWAKSIGGLGRDAAHSIVADSSGNVIIAGTFTQQADFDPGPAVHTERIKGDPGMYLLKLDKLGYFEWVKVFDQADPQGPSIDLDDAGNIYCTGIFRGCDLDPGPGSYMVNGSGYPISFIFKLDKAGEFSWAKIFSGHYVNANILTADKNGVVYITGTHRGGWSPDSAILDLLIPPLKADGIYVMKLGPQCPLPAAAGPITGSSALCTGIPQTFSISTVQGVNQYLWSVPAGWTISSGQYSNSVIVIPGPGSGLIKVKGLNSCGSGTESQMMLTSDQPPEITLHPVKRIIHPGSGISFSCESSSPGVSYQWQQNSGTEFTDLADSGSISGVNTPVLSIQPALLPLNKNKFRCLISHGNCSIPSDEAELLFYGLHRETDFIIYPNPAEEFLTIQLNDPQTEFSYQLTDAFGKVVLTGKLSSSTTIDISRLAAAIYYIRIEDWARVVKVVKL